ncbi:MAG TPA: type IV pilus assembly protein PilM [Acidimicrobiia bacterium]|nr:type IV pilus assembly protein PilM [Acidimicrobiia bacterium]
MAERVLGLDVGTSAVRVVEVAYERPVGRGRQSGRPPVVTRVGEVPLPPGAVRDGEVADPTAVGAAIRELWRQTGLRPRDVRVGLTGSRVVVRVVDMPTMPDDELAGAIRFSAADHIPIPLDEAVLDHAVLEPAPPAEPGGPPQVRVLVAAAHRSALDGLLAAVTAGGLRAVAVDLVPFALVRALSEPAQPSDPAETEAEDGFAPPAPLPAEAIVSVGASMTTVVVHEAGRPRFVRTVQAGGDMLTAAISEELGIEIDAAEVAKHAGSAGGASHVSGGGPLPSGHPAAMPWGPDPTADGGGDDDLARRAARVVELRLAGILGEIQSGLAYWMHQSERPLQRIVLTGGGARAGDLAGRLALLVGAPVELGVVQGLEPPEAAAGAGDWADHTVAAGLALGATAGSWQIDLCPPAKRSFRFTGEMARRLAVAAVIVAVLLGGLSVRSVLALSGDRADLASQKKVNAKMEAELANFDHLRRLQADLDGGRKRVQTALAGDVSWTRFLDGLVRSMPDSVWLQSLTVQAASGTRPTAAAAPAAAQAPAAAATGGSVQFTAIGLDYPAVADWLRKVAADPALTNLAVAGLTQSSQGNRSIVNFTSTANLTTAARSDRAARLTKAAL